MNFRFADPAEFDQFLSEHSPTQLDVFILDVNGRALGKRLPVDEARSVFLKGMTFSACAPLLDCRGHGHDALGLGRSDGDPDGMALPLANTLCPVPWAQAPLAQVMAAMHDPSTRQAVWFDPRLVLSKVVQRYHALGMRPVLACELEFYLLERTRDPRGALVAAADPLTGSTARAMNLSVDSIQERHDLLSNVALAASHQRVPLAGTVSEYGAAQFELNLKHIDDPVLAADHACLLKRIVRGVARARGIDATFMAKPFGNQPGSGLHVHVSLADQEGRNLFSDAKGMQLMRHCVGGMQRLLPESLGVFAPNFNSHRRYGGQSVPLTTAWGFNNRSVAFRIPAADGPGTRIEHRVAGADASPHLVVAAILAAMLHGITHRLEPTAPTQGRSHAPADEARSLGVLDSLQRLEEARILSEYLPQRFLQAYAQLKRGEFAAFLEEVSPREVEFYA